MAVIGAGCIGASTAKHLAESGHTVVVLEKEPRPARHQSGRNSGVIHAGYNLKPGSRKARYCVEGSRAMRAYCQDRGVVVQETGILVVAGREEQRSSLERLLAFGRDNGVTVRSLEGDEIPEVEPHAVGVAALHAPEGASVDATGYVGALTADAQRAGASFFFGQHVKAVEETEAGTQVRLADGDPIRARVAVNAAGLHADRIAASLAPDLRVVPFRGDYAVLSPERSVLVRSHIYSAPDPRFPFLGVHLSRRVDGTVAVGPGAMLAFGREAYRFWQVQPRDLWDTLSWPGFWRIFRDRGFRRHVRSELGKSLSLRAIAKEARDLVPGLSAGDLSRTKGRLAGNRAQLVRRDGTLEDDIVVRETDHAVHVLNAVSPGLTCSLPFGAELARRATAKL